MKKFISIVYLWRRLVWAVAHPDNWLWRCAEPGTEGAYSYTIDQYEPRYLKRLAKVSIDSRDRLWQSNDTNESVRACIAIDMLHGAMLQPGLTDKERAHRILYYLAHMAGHCVSDSDLPTRLLDVFRAISSAIPPVDMDGFRDERPNSTI